MVAQNGPQAAAWHAPIEINPNQLDPLIQTLKRQAPGCSIWVFIVSCSSLGIASLHSTGLPLIFCRFLHATSALAMSANVTNANPRAFPVILSAERSVPRVNTSAREEALLEICTAPSVLQCAPCRGLSVKVTAKPFTAPSSGRQRTARRRVLKARCELLLLLVVVLGGPRRNPPLMMKTSRTGPKFSSKKV